MTQAPLKPVLAIFDLDGTLVPTMHGFADIAGAVIQDRYGWNFERARQAYLATSGIPFFQQLESLFPKDPRNGAASEEFEDEKEHFFRTVHMDRNVREALRQLRAWGVKLAVSSNNFEPLVISMIQREAADLFDSVLGYRDGFSKGPDHFNFLFNKFKITPTQSLFIGDSLSDYSKAVKAGIPFVGVTGTFTEKEFKSLSPAIRTVSSVAFLPSFYEFMHLQGAEV